MTYSGRNALFKRAFWQLSKHSKCGMRIWFHLQCKEYSCENFSSTEEVATTGVVISFPELSGFNELAPHPPQPRSRPLVAKLIWRELAVCFFLCPNPYSKLLGMTSLSDKITRKKVLNHKKICMTLFWTSYYYFAQCRTWGRKTLARMRSGL